jgi:hypothetical protein
MNRYPITVYWQVQLVLRLPDLDQVKLSVLQELDLFQFTSGIRPKSDISDANSASDRRSTSESALSQRAESASST